MFKRGALSLVFMSAACLGATFDSQFLSTRPTPKSTEAPTKEKKAPRRRGILEGLPDQPGGAPGRRDETAASALRMIQSLTQILAIKRTGTPRNLVLLDRAAAINLYIRRILVTGKALKIDQNGMNYLKLAIADATGVLTAPDADASQRQRAHYVLGFSNVYLENVAEARSHFLQLLQLNPRTENAGWIGFYLAEDQFENGHFKEALADYRAYFGRMTPQQKELATYKSAWCLSNMNEPEKAEKIFASLIKRNSKQGLGKDSVRDLAFLLAHHKDSADAIQVAARSFADPADQIEFLGYVRSSLESQNSTLMHTKVVDRLMVLEKDPGKKLDLMLANVRVNRKLYASREHMAIFTRLRNLMSDSHVTPKSPAFRKNSEQLMLEAQALMKAYLDTFAGRTLTPEALSREEQGAALKVLFEFFDHYYPEAKERPAVVSTWLDVCHEMKDWKCVDQVAEVVGADSGGGPGSLARLVERAQVDQLGALEELCKATVPPSPALEERRLKKLKLFVDTRPHSEQWLRVSKRYAELLTDAKRYRDALPVLDLIFRREKSADSFFRLQWVRFQLADYRAVLDDPRGSALGAPEPRLADLRREATLALASGAKGTDDFKGYSANIHAFLASNPDPKKAMVAREDYLRFLMRKNMIPELTAELTALGPRERLAKQWEDLFNRAWYLSMETGRFKDTALLLRGDPGRPELSGDLFYRRLLLQLAGGQPPSLGDLRQLAPEKRDYLLGVLALLRPALALDYLGEQSHPDRDLALLALRIEQGEWQLTASPRAEKLLGRDYKFAHKGGWPPLVPEVRIERVKFPTPGMKPDVVAKTIGAVVTETQQIRAAIPGAIKDKPAELQLRAVEKARDHEARVGGALLSSPVPPELKPAEVEQYKKGIQEAAKEFLDASADFEKLAATFREVIAKGRAKMEARILSRPAMAKWPWPESFGRDPALGNVRAALNAANYLGALVLLDFFRPEHVKSDGDYFKIRSGILLSSPHTDPLRIYLLEELEKNKQEGVIAAWRLLTAPTGPKSGASPAPEVSLPEIPLPEEEAH